jgi:hypothetical protein
MRITDLSAHGTTTKRGPTKAERETLIAAADHRCAYCELPFGTFIQQGGKVTNLRPVMDHFVPYCYLQSNPATNWVVACHMCNAHKSGDFFTDFPAAKRQVFERWLSAGHIVLYIPDVPSTVDPLAYRHEYIDWLKYQASFMVRGSRHHTT